MTHKLKVTVTIILVITVYNKGGQTTLDDLSSDHHSAPTIGKCSASFCGTIIRGAAGTIFRPLFRNSHQKISQEIRTWCNNTGFVLCGTHIATPNINNNLLYLSNDKNANDPAEAA